MQLVDVHAPPPAQLQVALHAVALAHVRAPGHAEFICVQVV